MRIFNAFLIPIILMGICWIVELLERFSQLFNIDFSAFGVYPRTVSGLIGILTAPFVHGSIYHILSNTLPFILLMGVLLLFYNKIALRVVVFIWIVTGLLVWIFARPAHHIGASGVIYGFASFLFFNGLAAIAAAVLKGGAYLIKGVRALLISLVVLFFYGGLVWGLFPDMYGRVSFESHLAGAVAGFAAAIIFTYIDLKAEQKA